MSLFTVHLSLELRYISHFFEQNLKDIDNEIAGIESNWDESQAETPEDFGNLMYEPMKREEITLRATYYELNALVERHLRSFAHEPYLKSAKHASVPKTIFGVPTDKIKTIRLIEDLSIGDVTRLIERYYEFSLDSIPQHEVVSHIREISNSYKHRGGYNDFRQDPLLRWPQRYQLEREKTRSLISSVRQFLLLVHKKVTTTENHHISRFEDDNGA